jgi:nucleotide-binding universal stress UspA family protein
MNAFRSLLVATDFSEDARNAHLRSAQIAQEHRAALELLHVVSKPSLALLQGLFPDVGDASSRIVSDAKQALDRIAGEVLSAYGISPVTTVQVGDELNEILAAAPRAELLVMGSRGTSPLRDLILGTTAERLLARSTSPALVIKQEAQKPYRRILAAIDFSPYSAAVVATAARLTASAELHVCHAFEVPFEGKLWIAGVSDDRINHYRLQARQQALATINRLLASLPECAGRQALPVVERGNPARVLLDQAAEYNADLIVIGKQGRSALEEFLLGSVTRHVLSDACCDVLVVHEKRALPDAGCPV